MADKDQDTSFLDKYKAPDTAFLEKYRAPATGPKEANPASEAEMFQQTISTKPDATETLHGTARGKFLSTGDPNRVVPRVFSDPQMGAAGIITHPTPTKQSEAEAINRGEAGANAAALSVAPLVVGGTEALGAGGLAGLGRYAIGQTMPIVRGTIGASAGRMLGREVGGWFGHPELGGKVGGVGGGLYGLSGGKVPRLGLHSLADLVESAGPEEAVVSREATQALPTIRPRAAIPTVEATPIESTQRLEHIPTVEATPVEPARGLQPIRRPEPTRLDLGELGSVRRPEAIEPPAAPSPLTPRGKIYTKQQMIDAGADGYLNRAVKMDIPVNDIEGREPVPAMEGGYKPGTPIRQPIEVVHENGKYTLYSGNHRVRQAEINGQSTIPAFVENPPQAIKLNSTNLQESGTMGVSSPGLKPIAKPTVEGVVNQAMGLKPLERGTPLREQLSQEAKNELSRPFAEATQTPAEEDPIKIKYPDPAIRKFVRANGEAVVDAAGGDQELLQKIHDLKNVDVREAAINAGIDLGTKHVGSKVALGEEQISRQDLLKQILDKGFKLKKVLDLAKPNKE